MSVTTPAAIWRTSLANASVGSSAAADNRPDVHRLRYEDLVGQPTGALRALGDFAGLDLDSVIDAVERQRTFEPEHGVRGNTMVRLQGPIRLRADEEWTRALPARSRWVALSTWPLARRYGYDVWRRAHPAP